MANRNEEYGQQRESATYGRSGSGQDSQQSRGQQSQEWGPRSQQHAQQPGQQQRYQQPMGGRDDFETQRYQSQGSGVHGAGYGGEQVTGQARGWSQPYDEFGESAQSWSQESGDSSAQHYGGSRGSQLQGQAGNQPHAQYGSQPYGQQQPYGQGQQFGQTGRYGSQQPLQGSQQYGQGRESLGYGAEQGGRYQGSGFGYGSGLHEERGQSQFGVGLGDMAYGMHGSSYGTGLGQRRSLRGKGPKNYSRSDERIKEELCERLTNDDDIDASEIEIKVEQGEVTLEGKVEERWMKHRAEDIADGLLGVRNVENRIRVEQSDLSSSVGKGSMGRSTVAGSRGSAATAGGSSTSSGSGITPH